MTKQKKGPKEPPEGPDDIDIPESMEAKNIDLGVLLDDDTPEWMSSDGRGTEHMKASDLDLGFIKDVGYATRKAEEHLGQDKGNKKSHESKRRRREDLVAGFERYLKEREGSILSETAHARSFLEGEELGGSVHAVDNFLRRVRREREARRKGQTPDAR